MWGRAALQPFGRPRTFDLKICPSTRSFRRAFEISSTSFAVAPTSRVAGRRTRNGSDDFTASIAQDGGPERGVGAARHNGVDALAADDSDLAPCSVEPDVLAPGGRVEDTLGDAKLTAIPSVGAALAGLKV